MPSIPKFATPRTSRARQAGSLAAQVVPAEVMPGRNVFARLHRAQAMDCHGCFLVVAKKDGSTMVNLYEFTIVLPSFFATTQNHPWLPLWPSQSAVLVRSLDGPTQISWYGWHGLFLAGPSYTCLTNHIASAVVKVRTSSGYNEAAPSGKFSAGATMDTFSKAPGVATLFETMPAEIPGSVFSTATVVAASSFRKRIQAPRSSVSTRCRGRKRFPSLTATPHAAHTRNTKENSYHIEVGFFMIEVQNRGRPREPWPEGQSFQ